MGSNYIRKVVLKAGLALLLSVLVLTGCSQRDSCNIETQCETEILVIEDSTPETEQEIIRVGLSG